ncbi:MAG: hypothetical protein ACKVRN_02245 [Pyrinomonadaceae bacterium]
MRLIIAAVLAGIVMFIWGAFSHMVLGIGSAGMKPMPNEAVVAPAMKTNISEPGVYVVPWMDDLHNATEEQQAAFAAKYKEGPTAFLIYHPTGEDLMSMKQFGVELGSNIAAALVVGMILLLGAVSFSRGVTIATLVGLAGWLSINVSYWNWYRFPTNFVTPELIDQTVGWLLSGFVLAFILRRRD